MRKFQPGDYVWYISKRSGTKVDGVVTKQDGDMVYAFWNKNTIATWATDSECHFDEKTFDLQEMT